MSAAFEEAEARKVSPARISGAVRSIDKSTSLDTNRDQTAAEQWVLGQPEPGDLDTLSQTLGGRPASGATTGCRRTTSPPKFFATALGKNQRRIQTRAMTDNMGENVDRLAIGRSKQGQWPGILAQAGGQPLPGAPDLSGSNRMAAAFACTGSNVIMKAEGDEKQEQEEEREANNNEGRDGREDVNEGNRR
eukprot:CAMPEP_0173105758 /NCGR_PEP_ID=MMETSP1102-20130122/40389_1 /TAXON_ID=49646 /ORGANISM="Geminigera sp., Strain Caron Lab Isolate" /LENGTH=190 /DNA_ID=CAMNT_0014002251 /DNA_START=85 /DNA_END=654 /DNA_ORIENTATION=-